MREGARMAMPADPGDVVYDERLKADISLYGRDRGTRERWRKSVLVEVGDRRSTGRHAFDANSCPFDGYHRRQILSDSSYREQRSVENESRWDAGKRFLGEWEAGCRRPKLIARLDGCVPTVGRGWISVSGASDGWAPWAEAYLAMDRWAACVQSVVCFDITAKDWALRQPGRLARPALVGMMALRLGLARLVRFYAIVDKQRR